jgi:hypothetical protein
MCANSKVGRSEVSMYTHCTAFSAAIYTIISACGTRCLCTDYIILTIYCSLCRSLPTTTCILDFIIANQPSLQLARCYTVTLLLITTTVESYRCDCVNYIRSQRTGVASFIPLDKIRPKPINERLRTLGNKYRLCADIVQVQFCKTDS